MLKNKILIYTNVFKTNEVEVLAGYLYQRFGTLVGLLDYQMSQDPLQQLLILKARFDYQTIINHKIKIPFVFDNELSDLIIYKSSFISGFQATYRQGLTNRCQNCFKISNHVTSSAYQSRWKYKRID